MSKKAQTKLSPLERAARNSLIVYLFQCGYSVNSIARVMNMTQSTVSRAIDKNEYQYRTITEIILNGR